jgi:hypothetical protein
VVGQTAWLGSTDHVCAYPKDGGLRRVGSVSGSPPAVVYVDTGCLSASPDGYLLSGAFSGMASSMSITGMPSSIR